MKIKVTNTYEVSNIQREAIAWSISSKNKLASHEECRNYLENNSEDLDDLVKSYYAEKAQYYQKLAEGKK